jgi:hypothetical protein
MTLHFSDGVSIDTSGPLRILLLEDGAYVVGQGNLIPVNSQEEAEERIAKMKGSIKPIGDYIDFEEVR